ncbi:hypothetical protein GON03_21790 [Nocardioides sp. MAH-18]|uniref:Uncharacterized protein n=1 Tax=Nocardioides agri TaxID=2682843 RepID=A0A6L6XX39_9ACTN|nr:MULTISPECIES: hypothetical protein [unclassified Nocardioides]MBA2952658.1 hypothetical protein [Nocardioides sp. CGMCC 1.13656]MVQ51820.1 hypothetical protein [Nocardioides sp. MAH-18]
MNTTGIHPTFAVDHARAQAGEAARRAEDIRRAHAVRTTTTPAPGPTPPARVRVRRRNRHWWAWPGFRSGAVAG